MRGEADTQVFSTQAKPPPANPAPPHTPCTSLQSAPTPPQLYREQLDASYDKLKALRQQEASLLAELQGTQASTSSSADELAGLQAQVDELARRKVCHAIVQQDAMCVGCECQRVFQNGGCVCSLTLMQLVCYTQGCFFS